MPTKKITKKSTVTHQSTQPDSLDGFMDLSSVVTESLAKQEADKRVKRKKKTTTPNTVTPENPTKVGICNTLDSAVEALNIPEAGSLKKSDRAATLTTYANFLDELEAIANSCDRNLGVIRWMQGQVLNRLKPIDKKTKSLIEHGEWQQILKKFEGRRGWSEENIRLMRHAANQFTRQDAIRLGWAGMKAEIRSDDKVDATAGSGRGSGGRSKPKPLTLKTLPTVVAQMFSAADRLDKQIEKMPDPFTSPTESLPIVEMQLTQSKAALENTKRIIRKLEKLRNELKALAQ